MILTMKRILVSLLFLILCSNAVYSESYSIYPVPQSLQMREGSLTLSKTVNIVFDKQIDDITRRRAVQVLSEAGYVCRLTKRAQPKGCNVCLSVDAKCEKPGKFDCHTIQVDSEGIRIVGQHTNAVFFGLASLEQLFEQSQQGTLAYVSIEDYADQKNRGVVEGYYGFPYSVPVKKDLLRYMMRYKMNTYMYGGKSDPFHSQFWQQPYPETITAEEERNGWMTQNQIRDIAQVSAETKVNFIWAIHPGNNFIESETVIDDIMNKFDKMHQLGIRQFALFVDDVSIPETTEEMELTAHRVTALQMAMEERWNHAKALAKDTVRPLHFVPQIYCSGFASSAEQRQNFMKAIGKTPEHITVYTTGQWVWTVPNCQHTENIREEFGREMAWWWNYPCNDNADGRIYPMDMYSNFVDMPAVKNESTLPTMLNNNIGIVANPMQQGEVSKTPLFSVADYAWNSGAFDAEKSWMASFASITKDIEVQQAYRFLADYLRWNEPKALGKLIADYKHATDNHFGAKSDKLRTLLAEIIANCETMQRLKSSSLESDRLLYGDLSPWLLKLKADCHAAISLMDEVDALVAGKEVKESASTRILKDLDQNTDYTAVALEGMGDGITTSERQAQVSQLYLEPFIDYLARKTITLK